MSKLMYVIILTCCLYILHIILTIINGIIINQSDELLIFTYISHEICIIFTCICTVYFQTQWLINKIKYKESELGCKLCNKPILYKPNFDILRTTNIGRDYKETDSNTLAYNSTLSAEFGIKSQQEMPKISENIPMPNNLSNETYEFEIKQPESIANNNNNNNKNNNKNKNNNNNNNNDGSPKNEIDIYNTGECRILFTALQADKLFDDFTRHLASELSMELSFAFIEFTQFRRLIERDTAFMEHINIPTPSYIQSNPVLSTNNDSNEQKSNSFVHIKLPRY